MDERPITPRTNSERLLLQIRDELRQLNSRLGQQQPNLTEPKRRTRKKPDDSDLSG